MFALHLGAVRRDTPNRLTPIEIFKFRPTRGSQFSCTGKRQNHEPQSKARPQITVIRAERKHKCRHLIERHCLVATRPAGRFQRAPEVGRRVILCSSSRNRVAENLAAELAKPKSRLDYPTRLDLPEDLEQFWRVNVCDRARSDLREDVGLKPGEKQRAVTGGQPVLLLADPLSRDGLKRICAGELGDSLSRPLRDGRIDIRSERRVALLHDVRVHPKASHRIHTERERAPLSSETIIHPPVTRAIRCDQKIHAATVAELVRLALLAWRYGCACRSMP